MTAVLPLLPVVQTRGRVAEASARAREADSRLELAKKNALLEIMTAYEDFRSAYARGSAFDKALTAAEENYKLQMQDYRLNLINNLDVLQTIQFLQNARRDRVHAVYDIKRAYWQLRGAAGRPGGAEGSIP